MDERFATSAADRFQALRRSLVLDLFFRRGRFWEVVHLLRARWNIDAPAQLPPALLLRRVWLDSVIGHEPEDWPRALPPHPRRQAYPPHRSDRQPTKTSRRASHHRPPGAGHVAAAVSKTAKLVG